MMVLKAERKRSAGAVATVGGDFFSPSLLSGTTRGEQMIALFNAMDVVGFGNHEFDFGAEAGRFPQVSGLTFTYDPKLSSGTRVTNVTVGGQPLDPGRTYRVATNDYMLKGGDGYAALTRGRTAVDASGAVLMATMVMDYVEAKKTVAPKVEGRIVAK